MDKPENYDAHWQKIVSFFPILEIEENIKYPSVNNSIDDVISIIDRLNLKDDIIEIVLINIQTHLRQYVVPKFWNRFTSTNPNKIEIFTEAVNELYNDLLKYIPILDRIEVLKGDNDKTYYGQANIRSVLKLFLHGSLYAQLPYKYNVIVSNFYEACLKMYSDSYERHTSEKSMSVICNYCGNEMDTCECHEIMEKFQIINRRLSEIGLLERLVIQEVISLIYKQIELHIKETCKSTYDISYLKNFENWLKSVVMSWLIKIYCGSSLSSIEDVTDNEIKNILCTYQEKLTQYLYETYLKIIIDQLFCIIIEYPDSQPIIDDIRICLPKTNLRSTLITKLQQALQLRLLHQGVSTPDILTAFVAAIRALRRLDPTGILLDTVTEPVRKYLRSRKDTVRCVVNNLTEEGPSELADELVKGEALQLDDTFVSTDAEDNSDWENWMPDPIDADPTKTSKTRRTSDIISMLVNIFGSKELFMNEYRTILADRLLSQSICNTEKEIRYLELLKVRFGDSQLHYCEVMLKDICDSKRINANLQKDASFMEESKSFPTTALILSAQFWPPFKDETFELLPEVKKQFEVYTKGFEALKGNRTLSWKPHLGFVDLEIEMENRTLNLTVSPILATVIMHFQEKNVWTIDELCKSIKVPPTILRRRLHFWQTQGVLREESLNTFILTEHSNSKTKPINSIANMSNAIEIPCEEEEMESALASAHDQREEELQVFWSYIVGMLTNLESMPLDRIHQMLKMFVSEGPTAMECSLQELRHFLDGKVREHKLLVSGGIYRLPKN